MQKLVVLVLLTFAIVPAAGCGMMRRTEQWKCDNLGLCWFGIRPSNQQQNCQPTISAPYSSYDITPTTEMP